MNAPMNPDTLAADLDAAAHAIEKPAPTTKHRIGNNVFRLDEQAGGHGAGVYVIKTDKDGNELSPMWLCAPLRVMAKTRSARSSEWGRLLEWHDPDGKHHQWAMPDQLISGEGVEISRELRRHGLPLSTRPNTNQLLKDYLNEWPTTARARCVDRVGWLGSVYVLPNEAIGGGDELVVFQSEEAVEPAFEAVGSAAGWRESAAALAAGNSRMMFAICCALAPPLADLVGEQSGGFHLRGGTSAGKSTALRLAASVWGNPGRYPRLWRATANGLEGLCALHNDGLLILDELSQCEPKEAGEAAYLLANGQGKARATRGGGAVRPTARWRLLFLSAGEETLSNLMQKAGKKTNAGQEIRLADIEADAGCGMGAFEVLHGLPSSDAIAKALDAATAQHYGAVGLAWLREVVRQRDQLKGVILEGTHDFVSDYVPPGASGQVMRVARRFGLVAVAGELATQFGLTGWQERTASEAVGRCFLAWLDGFGGIGNKEDRTLLAQVRSFMEAHGSSRFENADDQDGRPVPNRAGFFKIDTDGTRKFYVLPEVFTREMCQGYEPKAAAKQLVTAGVVQPDSDGKSSRTIKVRSLGRSVRVYALTAKAIDGED